MAPENELTSQLKIIIEGSELPQEAAGSVAAVIVDQHSHLPDMFAIRVLDRDMKLLDEGPFNLTGKVKISAENQDGREVVLIEAEITAIEPQFGEGMVSEFIVRGYDASHRLFRQTKTQAFINIKDSDLAAQIAQEAGLRAEVETTPTVFAHIFQDNQTDLEFLTQRAFRIGFECFVSEGKLFFRKPPARGENGTKLTWGDDLLAFQARMTLAEQVDEVVVRGWDPAAKQAIVGKAERGLLYPQIGESKNGAEWASGFGAGKKTIVDTPIVSQAEADGIAGARLNELSGAFVEADGTAFRRPEIRAGKMIRLEGLGDRFSGSYLVTGATHQYTPEGLSTYFSVRGARTGLLSEEIASPDRQTRYPGVVVGTVTNTDDPEDWGRVKLKFPWISDDVESAWARLVGAGAGPNAGLYTVPEVGDEVLVAFEHGDINYPVVIGGLWNGQDQIPEEASGAPAGDRPKVRTFRSRTGHRITLNETSEDHIIIETADGLQILMSDRDHKIVMKSDQVSINMTRDSIELQTGSNVSIKASGNLKLEASGNVDIQAGGNVTVKGATINLN